MKCLNKSRLLQNQESLILERTRILFFFPSQSDQQRTMISMCFIIQWMVVNIGLMNLIGTTRYTSWKKQTKPVCASAVRPTELQMTVVYYKHPQIIGGSEHFRISQLQGAGFLLCIHSATVYRWFLLLFFFFFNEDIVQTSTVSDHMNRTATKVWFVCIERVCPSESRGLTQRCCSNPRILEL